MEHFTVSARVLCCVESNACTDVSAQCNTKRFTAAHCDTSAVRWTCFIVGLVQDCNRERFISMTCRHSPASVHHVIGCIRSAHASPPPPPLVVP